MTTPDPLAVPNAGAWLHPATGLPTPYILRIEMRQPEHAWLVVLPPDAATGVVEVVVDFRGSETTSGVYDSWLLTPEQARALAAALDPTSRGV